MILNYYHVVLAVAAVLIFFTNLDGYLFSAEVLPDVPPVYWIGIYLLLASPLLLKRKFIEIVHKAPIVYWCYCFLIVSGIWLFFQSSQSDKVWQEFRLRVLAILFVLCMLVVLSSQRSQLWARYTLFFVVLLAVLINFYELFYPSTFSTVVGRSAGLYRNPNQSGNALVLGMILCIGLLNQRFRLVFLLLVLAGVVLTFSRAAIAGYFIALVVLTLTGTISLRKSLLIGVTGFSISFVALLFFWDEFLSRFRGLSTLNRNVPGRINWVTSLSGTTDYSIAQRRDVARAAWQMFTERPIWGNGLASTKDWTYAVSSHNQYLSLMADHGIVGVLILPLLVLAVTWKASGELRQIGQAFAAFTLFMGFFSHNILDERYFLMMFAMMAAMVVAHRMRTIQIYPLIHESCPSDNYRSGQR